MMPTMAMTRITASAPTHAPALKMPPTTSHPGRKTAMTSSASSWSWAIRFLPPRTDQAGGPELRSPRAVRVVALARVATKHHEHDDSAVDGGYLLPVSREP